MLSCTSGPLSITWDVSMPLFQLLLHSFIHAYISNYQSFTYLVISVHPPTPISFLLTLCTPTPFPNIHLPMNSSSPMWSNSVNQRLHFQRCIMIILNQYPGCSAWWSSGMVVYLLPWAPQPGGWSCQWNFLHCHSNVCSCCKYTKISSSYHDSKFQSNEIVCVCVCIRMPRGKT